MVDFGDICGVLNLLPQAGGIAAIHDEDNDIVMHMYEKLFREDRTDFGRPRPRPWPSLTMLRGKMVVEGGTFSGDLKDGQFLLRKVPDEIRARPVV
jgi:hypothetical protein